MGSGQSSSGPSRMINTTSNANEDPIIVRDRSLNPDATPRDSSADSRAATNSFVLHVNTVTLDENSSVGQDRGPVNVFSESPIENAGGSSIDPSLLLNIPYSIRRTDTLGTVQLDDGGINNGISSLRLEMVDEADADFNERAVNLPYSINLDGGDDENYDRLVTQYSQHLADEDYLGSDDPDDREHILNDKDANKSSHIDSLKSSPSSISKMHTGMPLSETSGLGDQQLVRSSSLHQKAAAGSKNLNSASEINSRLDTQVEVRIYPCNNSTGNAAKKKYTQFSIKPEGVIIQGTHRHRSNAHDIGSEYASYIGRKLQRYELSDNKACQLLVTTHNKSFWVVPAPEAFSRHSGTCRLLGDRKHPQATHSLQVGDFLRVGSVGIVVVETHNGIENKILSEEKIQKIMNDTTNCSGGFLDCGDTDGENSDDSSSSENKKGNEKVPSSVDTPLCYMCFDDESSNENPLIAPCKCRGDTRYVHVNCLRKWHAAETDNQICFLSSVDATCSVCKSNFKADIKLRDGRLVKLFKSSLEPPYVSLLVATKHEMAQRLFNTRFQLSFSTLMKSDGLSATRPLLLGRSSGSDMVLDYRTVSARHAKIIFKNGEFIFTDAGSSNGSYLYLRRPVELSSSQPVQFRMGRSMISMKVVNKWNRRLLRAVRRSQSSASFTDASQQDELSVGSNDDDVRVIDCSGNMIRAVSRKTRESIINSLPPPGLLSQQTPEHLALLQALAYPKRSVDKDGNVISRKIDGASSRKRVSAVSSPVSESDASVVSPSD